MTCHIPFWNFLIVWFTLPLTFLLIKNVSRLTKNFFNGNNYIFKILLYTSIVRSRCFKFLFMFGFVAKLCFWVRMKTFYFALSVFLYLSSLHENFWPLSQFFFLKIWSSPGSCSTSIFFLSKYLKKKLKIHFITWSRAFLLCS